MIRLLLALLLVLLSAWPASATNISESFNKANGALGPDLTWTSFGALAVVSNTAQATATQAQPSRARAESDLSTKNHFAQATVRFTAPAANSGALVIGRFSSSAETGYELWLYTSDGGVTYFLGLYSLVAGTTAAALGTDVDVTALMGASNVLRIEVAGTSPDIILRGVLDGAVIQTVTGLTLNDGNVRTGIAAWRPVGSGAGEVSLDDFSAGDLAPGGVTATCSQMNVLAAVDQAADGATVRVPAGTCNWSNLTINNKAISLIGAGAGTTNITGFFRVFTINTKATGGTIPGLFRLSGFQFTSTGGCTTSTDTGAWSFVTGFSPNIRLDHNAWIGNFNCPMLTLRANANTFAGVADHNTFTLNSPMVPISIFDYTGDQHGDESWAAADNMGSQQLFYFENNTVTNNDATYHITDGWRGSRIVWRYNTLFEAGVGNHGTESGGRDRGMRQIEVYENDFWIQTVNDAGSNGSVQVRGGTGVIYNNRLHVRNGKPFLLARMDNFRRAGFQHPQQPWGPCGISTATFTQSGGTATAATPAAYWTGDSNNCAAFAPCEIVVAGTTNYNGTHAITAWVSDTQVRFSVGGSPGTENGTLKQIWDGNTDSTGYRCMDQVGSGPSNLFTDPSNNGDAQPIAAASNTLSPVYCWGNTVESGGAPSSTDCSSSSTSDTIVVGRDVITDGTVKPGYTALTYPHPLIAQTDGPSSTFVPRHFIIRHRGP